MSIRTVNEVTLIGNVVIDPEYTITKTGRDRLYLRIVTNDTYRTDSGEWKTVPNYINIIFWGLVARNNAQLCRVGTKVYIKATLRSSVKTDKDKGYIGQELRVMGRDMFILARGREKDAT